MTNKISLSIPKKHPCFEAHFPGQPIVPGALLLAWVRASLYSISLEGSRRIQYAKFLKPVLPGMELEISIEDDAKGKAKISLIDPLSSIVYVNMNYGT